VPLSLGARAGNALLVLALVGAGGGFWWHSHTQSPEYVAGQKLRRADESASAGRGGEAAQLCREVIDSRTSKSEEGAVKLAGYIDRPPGPPAEAAAVYQVAADLHRESRGPVPDLFARGKPLAERLAPDEPAAALALLEVIGPFAPDARAELDLRRDLLERLFARSPDSPEAASRFAAVLEENGERERCEQLLAPFEGRLGALDGAAVLGRIYSARGQFDKAHALLAPFVEARLPALRAAEAEYKAAHQAAEARVVEALKTARRPGSTTPGTTARRRNSNRRW
jgi:tetratricopeptide (TPR) repeat protein